MKRKIIAVAATALILTGASLSQAGDVENGKVLFASPTLGGGTSGKTCLTCHPGGKRLSGKILQMDQDKLAGIVNQCIAKPLAGKSIDPEGEEMMDVIAYMKTLVQ